jgi:rRNA maturation endonuclease Nob1
VKSPIVTTAVGNEDDDDVRSVITSITTATITPSESASGIFRNKYDELQEPSSSSGASTPRSRSVLADAVDLTPATSEISMASTAKPSTQSNMPVSDMSSLALEEPRRRPEWTSLSDVSSDWQTSLVSNATVSDWSVLDDSTLEHSIDNLVLSDSDSDDEGKWITPTNIKKHKIRDITTTNSLLAPPIESRPPRRRSSPPDERGPGAILKSACMTSDFAMQNVALQMGLNLISTDGLGVRQVKTWVLRCHGCFKTTKNMELKFCPSCGGNTLLRTSTSTSASGEVTLHLKKSMQWTNRGTKVSPHLPPRSILTIVLPPETTRTKFHPFTVFPATDSARGSERICPGAEGAQKAGEGSYGSGLLAWVLGWHGQDGGLWIWGTECGTGWGWEGEGDECCSEKMREYREALGNIII